MDADAIYREYISGNENAFERLVEAYGDRLTLFINGFVQDLHDAEDLMIEVFAYIAVKKPHIHSNFNNYIYRAARNYAISFIRKKKKIILFAEEKMDFRIEATCENDMLLKERNAIIYNCMDKLNSAQREALYLVYIEKMSYRAAAEIMHKSEKQVDKLLQVGKKKIKPMLETEGIANAFDR